MCHNNVEMREKLKLIKIIRIRNYRTNTQPSGRQKNILEATIDFCFFFLIIFLQANKKYGKTIK